MAFETVQPFLPFLRFWRALPLDKLTSKSQKTDDFERVEKLNESTPRKSGPCYRESFEKLSR
jgi:hypothetical protein